VPFGGRASRPRPSGVTRDARDPDAVDPATLDCAADRQDGGRSAYDHMKAHAAYTTSRRCLIASPLTRSGIRRARDWRPGGGCCASVDGREHTLSCMDRTVCVDPVRQRVCTDGWRIAHLDERRPGCERFRHPKGCELCPLRQRGGGARATPSLRSRALVTGMRAAAQDGDATAVQGCSAGNATRRVRTERRRPDAPANA
jgi:hypothetical protein